jgi:hypothetical protein
MLHPAPAAAFVLHAPQTWFELRLQCFPVHWSSSPHAAPFWSEPATGLQSAGRLRAKVSGQEACGSAAMHLSAMSVVKPVPVA